MTGPDRDPDCGPDSGPDAGPNNGPDGGPWLYRTVTITGSLGLHARPAARFVKLAETFDAEITVANKSGKVSGGSIMGLMMLAAASGTELDLSACGPEAGRALDVLIRFIENGFETD